MAQKNEYKKQKKGRQNQGEQDEAQNNKLKKQRSMEIGLKLMENRQTLETSISFIKLPGKKIDEKIKQSQMIIQFIAHVLSQQIWIQQDTGIPKLYSFLSFIQGIQHSNYPHPNSTPHSLPSNIHPFQMKIPNPPSYSFTFFFIFLHFLPQFIRCQFQYFAQYKKQKLTYQNKNMRFSISLITVLACNQAYAFFDNGFFSGSADNDFGGQSDLPISSQSIFDSYFSRFSFNPMPNKIQTVDSIKPVDNPFFFPQLEPTLKSQAPLKELDLNEQKTNVIAQPSLNIQKSIENIGKPLSDLELIAQKKHSEIYENLSKQLPFDDLALNIQPLPTPKIAPKQEQVSPPTPLPNNIPKISDFPKPQTNNQDQIRKAPVSEAPRPQAPVTPQIPPTPPTLPASNKPEPSQGGGAPQGVIYQIRPKKR